MSQTVIDQALIDQIQLLLTAAENGKEDEVNCIIDELSASRGTAIYQQLGELTRNFHSALSDLGGDSRLAELANTEFDDARERLHFVINKTQEAADLTMSQVEESIPLCDSLIKMTNDLSLSWDKFSSKTMKAQEFRELSKNIKVFLKAANKDGEALKINLNQVLLAQDFQDITGQVIYKVIKLVENIEASLVNIITLASEHQVNMNNVSDKNKNQDKTTLDGPVVAGVANMQETVSGQDEVDDLLSSLGF